MSKKLNKNVPQLRFPEFEGDWKSYKLSQLFEISAGGDIDINKVRAEPDEVYKYPVYANAEKNKGLYGYSNEYKVEPHVITVAGRGVNIGIAHAREHHFYPIVRLLVLKPKAILNIYFFEYQINRMNIFVESTGVPQLTAPQISSYKIFSTQIAEQEKIALFLGAVDKRLNQLKRKRELLQTYKRGIRQKLFSQQIRFTQPDGFPFPDWEEKTLGEFSNFFDSQRIPLSSEERKARQGIYPYYGASGIIDSVNDYLFDGSYILLAEDGANILNRSSPIAFMAEGKFWVNNHAHILKSKGSDKFLVEYLENLSYEQYNTGTTQPKLNAEICKKIKIKIPSLEEQEKIANFLAAIDRKIEILSHQIEQTEQFKKGLLQKMFV